MRGNVAAPQSFFYAVLPQARFIGLAARSLENYCAAQHFCRICRFSFQLQGIKLIIEAAGNAGQLLFIMPGTRAGMTPKERQAVGSPRDHADPSVVLGGR
ncbi:hypothetical protein EFD56_30350 [Rhizobium phaseoli]|nr:hypothetical protein EFD56_30350 [Rhizobium phaseoli]